MTIQAQDLRDLIVGTLRIVEPTKERDSSHRVVWRAECVCGVHEYGSRPVLEKYAGHGTCPGHPFKGREKPVKGFRLTPDDRGTPEHAAAVAAWESRRSPEQPKENGNKQSSINGNKTLRDRLGLSGYRTETVIFNQVVNILGGKAEKVVFAKQIDGEDRVLLHVLLVDSNGKRCLVSSRKRLSPAEWAEVTEALASINILWRDREFRRTTKAA